MHIGRTNTIEIRVDGTSYPSLEGMIVKLSKSKALLETILEVSLAGYWLWDIKENSIFLSPSFKKMFGYGESELNEGDPNSWQKLMHQEDIPGAFGLLEKHFASRGGIPYENEVRYYHKDGSIIWVYCKGRVIEWDDDGNAVRMVGCHVDITGLKKAEKAQRIAAEMELKIKELEQFAYVASHDLQSPLNALKGLTQLLVDNHSHNLDGEARECIDKIQNSVQHMSYLIREILAYYRLGKKDIMTRVDCNRLLSYTLMDLSHIISRSNCQIIAGVLPVVNGYETQLRLLFKNIIENAIQFGGSDELTVIKLDAIRDEDYWLFSIQDNGPGISKEYYKTIFKIFQRLDTQCENDGAGIGLAQCQKIVEELHKGRIWVESEIGKGSTFYFSIPA